MKKLLLSMALVVAAPFAWAQVSETTTTTTTGGSGTITEYTPGSQIVLKESSGPKTYRFGKTVTYVTRSGKVLDPDVVKTRIKVGIPVHVHYVGTGDNEMVDRVIVDED
jgi:pectate lyase